MDKKGQNDQNGKNDKFSKFANLAKMSRMAGLVKTTEMDLAAKKPIWREWPN